ncbi:thioredoxin [Ceratobasidium sp. AG-Ba]|nr:thioredoxin [Ceratobasidium sp. AG-Ba]QRW14727.1 thioredoxin [Ceratobasidium sp. AG-Ba]
MYPKLISHNIHRTSSSAASIGLRRFSLSRVSRREFRDVSPEVFEKVVLKASSKPVVVDFYADWCQPCRMLSPILEKYTRDSSNLDGKEVDLVTVNVDEQQELAAKYKISALPTVVGFKNGQQTSQFVGLLNQSGVRKFLMDL